MKLKIIIIYALIYINFLNARLKINGKIDKNYQLLEMLSSVPLNELEGSHSKWILEVYKHLNLIDNNLDINDANILNYFTKDDALKILKPIFNFNNLLTIKPVESYFNNRISVKTDLKLSDIEYFKQDFIADHLYKTALKITSNLKEGTILVVGQTPSYLGHMIQKINDINKDNLSTIFIPYSGRPNTTLIRVYKYEKWDWTMSSYQEIITCKRENFFRNLLIEIGFDPKKYTKDSKIYILDNSRGPSIASFLTILCRWYQELSLELPDFYFICMDSYYKPLDFKMNDHLSFEIDTIYLNMDDLILNHGFDQIFDNLRLQPPFNAYLWNTKSKNLFSQYPRPQAKELLNYYLDYTTKNLT